jgi:hypothetical protein
MTKDSDVADASAVENPPVEPNAEPVRAPTFYGSLVHANMAPNDATILFGTPAVVLGDGTPPTDPICIVRMSPQTMKDLALVLARVVERHEKVWGEIKTPFSTDPTNLA